MSAAKETVIPLRYEGPSHYSPSLLTTQTHEMAETPEGLLAQREGVCKRIADISPETVSKPCFFYLDIMGIGYPVRLMLHYAGEEFDDIRIPLTVWLAKVPATLQQPATGPVPKDTTRNKHLPLYVDKDIKLQQSSVILKYVAKKYGFWPKTEAESWRAEEIMSHLYDCIFHYTGIFQPNQKVIYGVKSPEYHASQLAVFNQPITGGWSKNLTTIQSYLRENKSGFLVGDSITVVDFNALNIVAFWYKCWDSDRFLKEFPVLEEYIQRLGRDPKIAEYNINKRCKTSWLRDEWAFAGHCQRLSQDDGHCGLLDNIKV